MQIKPWLKFSPQFIHDPRIRRLPQNERYTMVCLICLAATNPGETPGVINLDDGDLAYTLELEIDDWHTLKSKFKSRGLIEFSNTRVLLPTWEEDQSTPKDKANTTKRRRKPEDPEKVKLRMQRHRLNKRSNQGVTVPVTANVTAVTANVTVPVTVKNSVTNAVTTRSKKAAKLTRVRRSPTLSEVPVTVPVTANVTSNVTTVTGDRSNPMIPGVSGQFVTTIDREREKRREDIKYTDPESARISENSECDLDHENPRTEEVLDPTSEAGLVVSRSSYIHPAVLMQQRLMGGGKTLPEYRTDWSVNGIKAGFLTHIRRYLESLPSYDRADLAQAKSWITKREFDQHGEGVAMIEIQVQAWLETPSEPNGMTPYAEVEGKANTRLVDRYLHTLQAVSGPSSQEDLEMAADVAMLMGYTS
jgi:hypothetical protein